MKKRRILIIVCCLLALAGICVAVYFARSSQQTKAFMTLMEEKYSDYVHGTYEDSVWRDVTPLDISSNSEIRIMVMDDSFAEVIMYKNDVYLIKYPGFNYYPDYALADLNGDGVDELYYSYTTGSGIVRTVIGQFDCKSREISVLLDDERFTFAADVCLRKKDGATEIEVVDSRDEKSVLAVIEYAGDSAYCTLK